MGAKKLIKNIETIMQVVKSPKDALLSEITRHNPKQKEIKNQLKIIKSTEKLDAKTRVIPNTKAALAKQKKSIESREKTDKNTDGAMGKGGGNSSSGTGNKKKKSFIKKVTGGLLSLFGLAAGKEILSDEERENVSETTSELLSDDEKLKAVNDSVEELEKLKADHKLFADLDGLDEVKKEELKEKIKEYGNFSIFNVFQKTWEESARDENNEKRSFFSRIGRSFSKIFSNIAFWYGAGKIIENKGIEKWERLEKQKKEAELVAEDLKKKGKKTGKSAKNIKKASRISKTSGIAFLRQQKILKPLLSSYREAMKNITPQTKNAAKKSQQAMINLFKKVKTEGVKMAFQNAMKNGKIKGMPKINVNQRLASLGKNRKVAGFAGGMGFASLFNLAIYDAINDGKFSTFGKSLLSKKNLTEAFIPGVGTTRSIKRNWNNSEIPTWLKVADIGLNAVGDVMLAGGYIASVFSFGASGAAGVAGRTAVVGVGRKWISKQTLRAARKSLVKSAKQGVKNSLVTSPFMAAAQIFAKKFNPKKVEQAFIDNVLTDEQRRSLELAKRMKPKVRQLNASPNYKMTG